MAEDKQICIFVKDLNVRTFTFYFKSSDKIEKIKTELEKLTSITPEEQRLMYVGKQLDDERCISEYGISDNSTIFLLLRMKGGVL